MQFNSVVWQYETHGTANLKKIQKRKKWQKELYAEDSFGCDAAGTSILHWKLYKSI